MKQVSSIFCFVAATILYGTISVQSEHAQNCRDFQNEAISPSGIYTIQPKFSAEPFLVYCNMDLLEGGWTYILNRFDGSVNFTRFWLDYKLGFGNIAGEVWLGLDHIHELTGNELNELLVELVDWNNTIYHEHYNAFSIGSEEQDYLLQMVGGASGDLSDSLSYHASQKFTTVDRDNDGDANNNCAADFLDHGGWWFNNCFESRLTGTYLTGSEATDGSGGGINWKTVGFPHYYSFKEARMMVRPRTNPNIEI